MAFVVEKTDKDTNVAGSLFLRKKPTGEHQKKLAIMISTL